MNDIDGVGGGGKSEGGVAEGIVGVSVGGLHLAVVVGGDDEWRVRKTQSKRCNTSQELVDM